MAEINEPIRKETMKWYNGHPVMILPGKKQKRKHRKKRINKKWLKRYGYSGYDYVPDGKIFMMDNGMLFMSKKTWKKLKALWSEIDEKNID